MPLRSDLKTPAASPRRLAGLASALMLAGLSLNLPTPCVAELIIEAPKEVSYATDGTGYFDLTIKNDGTTSANYSVGGDVVTINLVGGSGVTFTGADFATDKSYLFQPSYDVDNSLSLASSFSDTSLTILDNADNTQGFTTIAPNDTFGLGRIYFSVDPMAPAATVDISIDPTNSSLSGPAPDASPVSFTTQDGSIVIPASVPEPSSLILALSGGLIVALRRLRSSGPVEARTRLA